MRILFSAGFFPTQSHPFASFISDMAKAMVRRGHQVTVIAPQSITHNILNKTRFLPDYERIEVSTDKESLEYINVYRPKVWTLGEGIGGKVTFELRKRGITRFLKHINKQFDIVYAHFWENGYNVLDYIEEYQIPMVVVSGEDKIILNRILSDYKIKKLRNHVAEVICVSSKNKEESVEKKLCNSESCVVIPNGADLSKFYKSSQLDCRKKLGFDEDVFIVAFVGRFIHRKGQMRIVEAIKRLGDEKIKAIFIGKSLDNPCQEPIGDFILFKGVVEHNEICTYLNAADVYVLPTLAEGCSNSIVEAMACGLPIISSDLPFNYDILDSSNSILVDPLNINEIGEAIKKLQRSPELRVSMSLSSLKKAQALSFDNRVKKILEIVTEVHNKSI